MIGDYGYPERRKSKKDKARKKKKNPYKRGGKYRSTGVKEGNRS